MGKIAIAKENEFAKALVMLLDRTGIFNRNEWADFLCVTQSTLSQWTKGQTTPRPDHLQKIIAYIENFNKPEIKRALSYFYKISNRPIIDIMPEEAADRFKGVNTISEYFIKTYLPTFQHRLSLLPAQLKKEALFFCNSFFETINSLSTINDNEEFYNELIEALRIIKNEKLEPLIKQILEGEAYKHRKIKYQPEIIHHSVISELLEGETNTNRYILESFDKIVVDQGDTKYRFCVVLWNFNDPCNIPINDMDIDEMLFIKIKGKFTWNFKGYKSIDLVNNNIFSINPPDTIQNSVSDSFSLPESIIEIIEPGFGIAVLFKEAGMALDNRLYNSGLYELLDFPKQLNLSRNPKEYSKYLNNIQLNLCNLPLDKNGLKSIVEKNDMCKMSNDPHEYQRRTGQMKDVFFHSIFKQEWRPDNEKIMSVKLVQLKKISNEMDTTKLVNHLGSEIIIPLTGMLRILSAGVLDGESIPKEYSVKDIGTADLGSLPAHSLVDNEGVPNIIFLNSETPHALLGNTDDTYCLHIRILKLPKRGTMDNKNKFTAGPSSISATDTTKPILNNVLIGKN